MNMSVQGSNKEAVFSIYLKDYYSKWAQLLGFDIINLRLEQRHANNNIDLCGADPKRRIAVYFELQLTKANKRYLQRIKEMMEKYPESVIIWVASSFDNWLIDDLTKWMKESNKNYLDFYAVTFSPLLLEKLNELNNIYKLNIYQRLPEINGIKNCLTVEYSSENLNEFHCGDMYLGPIQYDYNRTEDVKRALLEVLNERMPYFLNFHYQKKMNQNSHIMSIGAGKSGITYRCSAKDTRNLAFVELLFDWSKSNQYEAFKSREDEIRHLIHPDITFAKRRIGVYFKPDPVLSKTFHEIAGIFEKMINYFSLYTYANHPVEG